MAILLTAKDLNTIEELKIPEKKYPHSLIAALNAGEKVNIETYQSIGNKARELITKAFEFRKINTPENVTEVKLTKTPQLVQKLGDIYSGMANNNRYLQSLNQVRSLLRNRDIVTIKTEFYGQNFVDWLALQASEDEA